MPVVVVGGTLNGLGVVRSLSQAGMPIYVVETTRRCAAAWSRHCRFVRAASLEGAGLIETLLELGSRLASKPVLILTSDQSVTAVSEHRGLVEALYRISLPSAPMVRALSDKALFQRLALREGLEVPRGICIASASEIGRIGELLPPVVIKPADKTLVLNDVVERAEYARTLAEAQAIAARMLSRAPCLVVQEWVEGADADIFFTLFSCSRDGEVLGLFTGRKLVCTPPAVGSTAICVGAPEVGGELGARTLRFLDRVGYRGLGSLEFKRDARDGRFVIIEPTVGRTDWQEEIAALCGVNLPLLTYWAELGQPALASGEPSAALLAWRSSMEFRAPRELLGPGTRFVDGFFRWSDPLPAAYYYGYERCVRRLWHRVARVIRRRPPRFRLRGDPTLDVDTTIVGAGPYGLSIAAHLKAASRPFQLFGTPLESWRTFMPENMVLKSERFASNLWDPQRRYTLRRYSEHKGIPYQAVGSPLSLALFLEYADWFREHTVGGIRDAKVVRLSRVSRGFRLELADGETLTSRRVVLATGHMPFRVVPPELQHLPEPLVLHSTRIGDVRTYAGRDVTIIGAGQSGLETAALLYEVGARVRLLARREGIEWNGQSRPRPLLSRLREPDAGVASGWRSFAISELPGVFRWMFPAAKRHRFVAGSYGPSGAWWLRERVDGKIAISLGAQIEAASVENGRVRLRFTQPDGSHEAISDHVIAATGFRIDIDQIPYLGPALKRELLREAAGIPALSSKFETSVPGLFIVGVASAPVFGPIMRFMYGAKHVAPVLTSKLAAT